MPKHSHRENENCRNSMVNRLVGMIRNDGVVEFVLFAVSNVIRLSVSSHKSTF